MTASEARPDTTDRSVQGSIDRYWSAQAPTYDGHQQRPERREVDREVWSRIWGTAIGAVDAPQEPGPLDVLDVGTGSGHVACLLASLGHRVTGVDLAEPMLELARVHGAALATPPRFVRGDAVDPPFAEGSFDVVTGRYVMWTLRDPAAAVGRWCRLLRPGGLVAMVDSPWFPEGLGHLYDGPEGVDLPLAEATTIDATAATLEDGGLRDVVVRPLPEVLELDRTLGVAPGHRPQMQYLITGRSGARPATDGVSVGR